MVNIKITGKDVVATEAIKDYVEKKMDRIERYFEGDVEVGVTIKTEKTEQIAEMNVKVKQDTYRAVTSHKDMYASIDKNIDILEGQIRKVKTRKDKANKEDSIKTLGVNGEEEATIENEIIKTIYYDIKPMTPEDAKLKLQEKPQDRFITFINQDTNKTNVLFKLKDSKNYGLYLSYKLDRITCSVYDLEELIL